ncbi:hypothetical protein BDR26DRAFT_865833 [Obelidium mucronatum]|nr:hypothetical protein BDR26DRAFT_865833 [Obelidium mucronatum]
MISTPNRNRSRTHSSSPAVPSPRLQPTSFASPSSAAAQFTPRTQYESSHIVSATPSQFGSPLPPRKPVAASVYSTNSNIAVTPNHYKFSSPPANSSGTPQPLQNSFVAQIRSRTASAVTMTSSNGTRMESSPTAREKHAIKTTAYQHQIEQRKAFEHEWNKKKNEAVFLQHGQQQQQHQHPNSGTSLPLKVQTFNNSNSNSNNVSRNSHYHAFPTLSPSTRSQILQTLTPTVARAATSPTSVEPFSSINKYTIAASPSSPSSRDRNVYNLDGTRLHPDPPIPSTLLDDMIDDVLFPVVDLGVDTNIYNPWDGTRIHRPAVPLEVEFRKEFEAWDRLHL